MVVSGYRVQHRIQMTYTVYALKLHTSRLGKEVPRLIFNFTLGDQAMMLLGMLGKMRRQSSRRKSG
jgi:hypothetical protein